MRNFTLALAEEHKNSGVGVHAFNPSIVDTDLLRQVESVSGYEKSLKALPMLIRMWGNELDVPAQNAVCLASSATDGRTGLEVNLLGLGRLLNGAIREFTGRIFGRYRSPGEINIMTIHSALVLSLPENEKNNSMAKVTK